MVKYEAMMENPAAETEAIGRFLGISVRADERDEILWKYSRDNPEGSRRGLHFNKARTQRYRTEMTQEQKTKCQEVFGEHLARMGYDAQ